MNVELSNNIDTYINVHLEMKKSVILLLVKFNFLSIIRIRIRCLILSIFNVWSIIQSKNPKKERVI